MIQCKKMRYTVIVLVILLTISKPVLADRFDIVTPGNKVSIYYDRECRLDSIAANLLAADIELLSGYRPRVSADITRANGTIIIIGSIHSLIIKGFRSKLKRDSLEGKWECYGYRLAKSPSNTIKNALFIIGSDYRGTAFGVFDLSARLGISPWYWWADVKPEKRQNLSIDISDYTSASPAVKYRGIFINDEDWGLQPWAAKTFEPETKDIGPKTYARVFELLLRLKANLIWPAMHPSTKAFFHYPGNVKAAEDYQIVVGSSHAEPMLRNNVGEWDVKTMGSFNYFTNKDKIYKYWEDRIRESKTVDAVFSLGMRGVHDGQMEGIRDLKEAVPVIQEIIADQRAMLTKYRDKELSDITQVLTPYKEVLEIYDNGLKLPDDVTLVWPDDNYGYITRLNNEKEFSRKGAAGVYYHASYWGRPHDYLWLPSTHPSLMREEMVKAYQTGANRLWVVNVGDIKPQEYNIQQFLDMAYNPTPFLESRYTRQHLQEWINRIFKTSKAGEMADVLWDYYQLAFERKPEFMGWSETEPETKTTYTGFNHFFYGDEAQKRLDRYDAIEMAVKKLRHSILARDADAFYQLVYYPVVCASWINKKFLYRDKAYYYGRQNRLSALDYAHLSKNAYDSIVQETTYYNTRMAAGKWKHMMSMNPRNLDVYREPLLPAISIDSSSSWGIAPEGLVTKDSTLTGAPGTLSLPRFDNLNRQKYFIDIFLSKSKLLPWTAVASNESIRLSETKGVLSVKPGRKQTRIWIDIDWMALNSDEIKNGKVVFEADGKQLAVNVEMIKINKPELAGYKGFIENNGFISMQATHFTRQNQLTSTEWKIIDHFGYTGNVLQALPISIAGSLSSEEDSLKRNNPVVQYDFYNFSSAPPIVNLFALPTHPVNDNYRVRCALSIDGGPLETVDFKTTGRSPEWKQNVLRNRAERKITFPFLQAGKHTLSIYAVDPGVMLDEIRIDLGGLKMAYSNIIETRPNSK